MAKPLQLVSRTDEEMKVDITDQLYRDARVDASDVKVTVHDGVATISGAVPSYRAKQAAWEDVAMIQGIIDIDDQLAIEYPVGSTMPTDEEMTDSVTTRLDFDPDVTVKELDVDVSDGVVTMEGTTDAYWKKMLAEDIAFSTVGVTGVVNNIAVVPSEKISDKLIAEDIVDALERSYLDEDAINVTVDEGEVTMEGSVSSGLEWSMALNMARDTIGVTDVKDKMTIVYG